MDIKETLRNFPLLKEINSNDLDDLIKLLTPQTFEAESNIITEGDMGDIMYILIDGVVDIIKTTIFGDKFVCATLNSSYHCMFGEMALLDKDRRSATVKAKTKCETLSIDSTNFDLFCKTHPVAGVCLLKFMNINLVRNIRTENDNLKLVYQALIEEIEEN